MMGLVRLSLWFDNPNKAAVLFACLALVATFAAVRSRRIACAAAFGSVAACAFAGLVLTFSRGGLLAFVLGVAVLLAACRRTVAWRRLSAVFVPLAAGVALAVSALVWTGRISSVRASDDASVGNRLVMWRTAPRMMADAPGGWGVGRSGAAFMSWYQPLDRHEEYRSLVSSHLTALVEFGRMGRLAYAAGWLFAFGVCVLRTIRRDDPLPLALWTCFGIAAGFSSVAEAWELWTLPGLFLLPALYTFRAHAVPAERRAVLAVALIGGTVLVSGFEAFGRRQSFADTPPVHKAARRLAFGTDAPRKWVVYDPAVLGGATYGRTLRRYFKSHPGLCCGIADSLADVPADAVQLAVCGNSADGPRDMQAFTHLQSVRVLSPCEPKSWSGMQSPETRVYMGEYAPGAPSDDGPNVTLVPGCGVYLPDWPHLAFE